MLYDQLLRSLAQGGEPLATPEEFARYVEAWCRAHPGRSFPILDDAMPWPIQRYRVLDLLRAFPEETLLRMIEGAHTLEQMERPDREGFGESGAPAGAFDAERVRGAVRRWRERMIRHYRLGGLVAEEG